MALLTTERLATALSNFAFLGTVANVSGNRIQVTRPLQTVADGTHYAAASGLAAAVSVGDRVLVLRTGASWVCVVKIVT